MRRCSLAVAALTVLAPLLVLVPSAGASTTKTASCTDGGGHAWTVKAVWGDVYADQGTTKVAASAVRFTTKSSKTKYVDYVITVVDGSGATVQKVRRDDRKFAFKKGKKYVSVNPKNPPSAPGRTKIVVSVGDGKDGKQNCSVTFVQPGSPSSPAPTASTCSGKEVVRFKGQGSADLAQYGQGNYNASAEMWGVNGYSYTQTMGVCTHDAWYVDVKTDNSKRDGAVKAYPSMRRIYHDWSTSNFSKDPLVSSFPRLDVTFGSKDPASCSGCIYDTGFDVWLNGIGNGSSNELMIWTHNVNQTPYGSKVASGIKIAGHTWDLWSGNSNHYLAFVPTDTSHIPSGTINLKDFTGQLMNRGRISSSSRLGQISYGVETVSTGAATKRWNFTKFTVADR
ncbi:MAG TPA: hypothetical protein VGC37_10780 [Friedmanniella sp.]